MIIEDMARFIDRLQAISGSMEPIVKIEVTSEVWFALISNLGDKINMTLEKGQQVSSMTLLGVEIVRKF